MTKSAREMTTFSFADELVDDLWAISDDELVAEAIEDYGSVDSALGNIDAEISAAINQSGKDKLAESRAALEQERRNQNICNADVNRARNKVSKSNFKETSVRLTLAARNGPKSSENDVNSALSDLLELQRFERSAPLPNFGSLPKAEYILRDLGISKPDEID